MKNFTATMLSFYDSVVSYSKQFQTGEKSESAYGRNNRINLFKYIFTRFFLWGFDGILSNLSKLFGERFFSILKGSNNLKRYYDYLNLVTSSLCLNISKVLIASRSLALFGNRTTNKNLLNIRLRELFFFLMISFVSFCSLAQNPTAPAGGFNIFVKNDATLITNETEGAVAIGGDLTLAGDYRVANNSAGTFIVGGVKIGLVVAGKIIYSSGSGLTINSGGYLKIGNCAGNTVWYTDPNGAASNIQVTASNVYNSVPRINLNSSAPSLGVSATNNPVCSSTSLDFSAAFNQLQSNSVGLASLTQNLFFTDQNGNPLSGAPSGTVTLKLIAGTTNVVNIGLNDFNNITNINYSNGGSSSTTPLIFNITVTGTSTATFTVPSMGGLSSVTAGYTLFNFPNASNLIIRGSVLEGSVLAPFANLNKISGANIEGQVIALSLIHNGDEIHNFPFNVVIPNSCSGVSGSATATGTTVCVGQPIVIKVSPAFNSYSWTKDNVFKSSSQNPTIATNAVSSDAGTYKVLVTDVNGCTATATTSVIVNELPVPTATNTGPVCTGTPITVKAIGGTNYSWRDGKGVFIGAMADVTIQNAVTANAGIYTVTVTNVNGCTASATTSVTINTSPNPTIMPVAPICLGGDIVLNVSGGTGNTYAWSGSNGFTSTQQNPTVIPRPTTAGTYTYLVTVSGGGGCIGTATTSVVVYDLPIATAIGAEVCLGTEIKVDVNPAFASYAWTGANNFTASTKNPIVTTNATNVNGGLYQVKVTDDNGCTAIATTNVTVRPLPMVTATSEITCTGGTIKLIATGNDTFSWSGKNNFSASGAEVTIPNATGDDAGIYTVTVINNGCTATATTLVTVQPIILIPPIIYGICKGSTATLETSFTATGKDWKWTPNGEITPTIMVTTAGTYDVSFSDKVNGCKYIATFTVEVNDKPVPTIATIAAVCSGQPIVLNVSGVTGSKFTWTGSDNFTSTVQNPTVTPIPTTVGVYTYSVLVEGRGECTGIATTSVTVKAIPILTVSTASICAGTTGTLTASGADSYSWSATGFSSTGATVSITNAGVYTVIGTTAGCTAQATTSVTVKATLTVTVNPITLCAGVSGKLKAESSVVDTYSWSGPNNFTGTTQEVIVSNAGIYTVIVTKDGCTAVATSTVEIKTVADIKATSAEVCRGATTTLTATGGATYSWTGPETFTAIGATPTVSVAGNYTVIGTTEGGCTGTATATLTVKNNPTVKISGDTVICSGSKVTLTANGTGTFEWTGSGNFTATTVAVNVEAGTYQVKVTNAGCSAVGTVKVVNDGLSINAGGATVCEGGSTSLTGGATATSGIKSYAWSGPSGFTSTEQSPIITKPSTTGTYTLTVTSKAGCIATSTAIIIVTPAVINTANVTFCKGGKVTLTATGGAGATYLWTGGATTSSIEVTTAGTYNVTITDVAGCISKGIFTVIESINPTVVISGSPFLCNGRSTDLTVNKGISGETYSWTGPNSFTSTSQVITVTKEGDYNVKVVTNGGCETTGKITVIKGFTPTAVSGPVCEGENLILNVSGGLTYAWVGPQGFTSSLQNPQLLNVKKTDAGVYTVTVTSDGCTATVMSTLIVYEKPMGGITATAQNSTCNQDISNNDGAVKLAGLFTGLKYDIVEGGSYTGTKKYVDAIDIPVNGIVKSGIENPATNVGKAYTVRVFNANNCYSDYTVTIQQVVCSCSEAKCVPYLVEIKSGKK